MQILYENMVVEWQLPESDMRQVERILWISPNEEYLYCIAMDDDKAFPVMKAFGICCRYCIEALQTSGLDQ